MFEVGDVVGSYTILAHLRTGGMADLFLGRREGAAGFRRLVAIKVVHPSLAEDAQLVQMFLDEALITARIEHPHVVHVEDLGYVNETYFLVMEYVHGSTLAQLMKVLGKLYRRMSPLVAIAIAARVAEGLHAAHETTDDDGNLIGLVHRDVSPQNILVSHRGHVKLIDFGVAKARLRSEQTQTSMLKGKVRYMSPEQASTGQVDRRSDVYALGIVLWEMLTMRRLFAGKTEFEVLMSVRAPTIVPPSRYVPGLPRAVDEVVLAALAPEPDARPASAKALRRMLAAALPRSMTLDSAHLAELMTSVVGDALERVRLELPEEVSRVLEAEASPRGENEPSAVDSMTVHSELVSFEEDELDVTPEVTAVMAEIRASRAPAAAAGGITGSLDVDFPAPDEAEAEPTAVGGVHEDVAARALAAANLDLDEPTVPHELGSIGDAPGAPAEDDGVDTTRYERDALESGERAAELGHGRRNDDTAPQRSPGERTPFELPSGEARLVGASQAELSLREPGFRDPSLREPSLRDPTPPASRPREPGPRDASGSPSGNGPVEGTPSAPSARSGGSATLRAAPRPASRLARVARRRRAVGWIAAAALATLLGVGVAFFIPLALRELAPGATPAALWPRVEPPVTDAGARPAP